MAVVRVAASFVRPAPIAVGLEPRRLARWPLLAAVTAFSSCGANSVPPSPHQRQLVLYTKAGCCLCDGLKEKLHAALSLAGPYSLHSVDLQIRDISGNAKWERMYQYEVPVLAKVLPDGTEETLPRLSPRLGVELIQKKIAAALEQ